MSETIRNLGKKPRSKKETERRYQEFISDDLIFFRWNPWYFGSQKRNNLISLLI